MRKVLLSDTLDGTYYEFGLVRDCRAIKDIEDIETLIIHTTKHTAWDLVMFLIDWVNTTPIQNYVYICENPNTLVTMIINGMNEKGKTGVYFGKEEILKDENTLSVLIRRLDELKNTDTQKNRNRDAVVFDSMLESYNAIKQMDKINKDLKSQLRDTDKTVDTMTERAISRKYKPYRYSREGKVLYIKEYGKCAYLTTMIQAYVAYLNIVYGIDSKIIFLEPNTEIPLKRYEDITYIHEGSRGQSHLYRQDKILTTIPDFNVFEKLFEDNKEVYIVVDRLPQTEIVMKGRVHILFAVGGETPIKQYNLDPNRCLVAYNWNKYNAGKPYGVLKNIPDYPKKSVDRQAVYCKQYKEMFNKLTWELEI